MSNEITIYVLGLGETFQHILNAVAAFTSQDRDVFMSFFRMTALVGIITASVGYLKRRDPMIFANHGTKHDMIKQRAKKYPQLEIKSMSKAFATDTPPQEALRERPDLPAQKLQWL